MVKVKWEMSREELVSFVERVLTGLKEGKVTLGEFAFEVPERAEVEIEKETKKGRQEIELEIKWELPAEGTESGTDKGPALK